MKRVLLVIGTRPEMIKMAPVRAALTQRAGLKTAVCFSGQHRELTGQVAAFFGVQPDYELDTMTGGQDLHDITCRVLLGMRDVLSAFQPDLVLVHGDTTTALAASLACFYARVPLGHVEAGLRTGDLGHPFPEELNRIVADAISVMRFAPTEAARDALLATGASPSSIHVTGNTVVDALLMALKKLDGQPFAALDLAAMPRIALLTAHRRESFGEPLRRIFNAIRRLLDEEPGLHVVFPVHPNPHVREAADECFASEPRVHILPPQPYGEFVKLMRDCHIILTDSGGVQEEAPALGKPVIVLRETTERPEGIAAGAAVMAGADPERIITAARNALRALPLIPPAPPCSNPYGDGEAAVRIAETVAAFLGVAS